MRQAHLWFPCMPCMSALCCAGSAVQRGGDRGPARQHWLGHGKRSQQDEGALYSRPGLWGCICPGSSQVGHIPWTRLEAASAVAVVLSVCLTHVVSTCHSMTLTPHVRVVAYELLHGSSSPIAARVIGNRQLVQPAQGLSKSSQDVCTSVMISCCAVGWGLLIFCIGLELVWCAE